MLDRYDDNLEDWLRSCGISPVEFGPAFRRTKVKVMVREPSKHNRMWSLLHKEEGDASAPTVSYIFEDGKVTN